MPLLEITKVSKRGVGNFHLKEVSLEVEACQRVALVGETGSGKSTLMKIMAGLEDADSGAVLLNDEKVLGPSQTLVPGHTKIAYLPQYFELQKFLRVEQVLQYANQLSPAQASNLFRYCRIHHLLERKTNELSGGERQRIALCRLLISKPQVLLLDEPFSNLDRIMKQTLKEVLAVIESKFSISTVLVSHDPTDTLSWANAMIVLKNGKVIQKGNPQEIYRSPKNEYVAAMLGDYSVYGKKGIITRPADWRVKKNKHGNATVVKVQMMGSYNLLHVKRGKDVILTYTIEEVFNAGDKVQLIDNP